MHLDENTGDPDRGSRARKRRNELRLAARRCARRPRQLHAVRGVEDDRISRPP